MSRSAAIIKKSKCTRTNGSLGATNTITEKFKLFKKKRELNKLDKVISGASIESTFCTL